MAGKISTSTALGSLPPDCLSGFTNRFICKQGNLTKKIFSSDVNSSEMYRFRLTLFISIIKYLTVPYLLMHISFNIMFFSMVLTWLEDMFCWCEY
jgi:hypothetical protein